MEANIRKERTEKLYAKQKLKQQIIEALFVVALVCSVIGLIFFAMWLKKQQEQI